MWKSLKNASWPLAILILVIACAVLGSWLFQAVEEDERNLIRTKDRKDDIESRERVKQIIRQRENDRSKLVGY